MLEITKDSHVDHVTPAHVDWLLEKFKDKNEFFIDIITLPGDLPMVDCGLYGPLMGDAPVTEEEVHYAVRNGRRWASRLVNRPMRKTHALTVIGGPDEVNGKPCVLYTAYGGPQAPREPGDVSLASFDQVVSARAFWLHHALAVEQENNGAFVERLTHVLREACPDGEVRAMSAEVVGKFILEHENEVFAAFAAPRRTR